ncbi:TPR-like protein [Hesseltinella vesiculosa]|uniref:TPR-like protein n=1 Tax=Hesseltinella vesiculosa TaxID=101127 RepID=A0A1X2GNT3_9FUNG|nr:TPR-like protein [Hesseltinella vesiculosa]
MSGQQQYTLDDLVPHIQENIDAMEYPLAYAFCEKALALAPTNAKVLEWTGQVEIELEKFAEAREHMLQAIQIEPDHGHAKYMYLGQLSVEKEAIAAFQKGVDLMVQDREQCQDPEEQKVLANKIATALCSMTEIYLTDCCFEPEAEQKCEEYLQQAQQVAPEHAEVYQLLASVRLSQQRNEEAAQVLDHSIQLWINKDVSDPTLPNYDSRLALVRLLLEVGAMAQAFDILERLQKENDQVVDLWYLYGWTYYILGEDAQTPEERQEHWENARDCLHVALKLSDITGYDDDSLLEHTKELITSINTVVPPSEPEEEEEPDEDVEFTSDNDDAMEM